MATWTHSCNEPLLDTPSGKLEAGFYFVNERGALVKFDPRVATSALVQANVIGRRYVHYFSDGSSVTCTAKQYGDLAKPGAARPVKS